MNDKTKAILDDFNEVIRNLAYEEAERLIERDPEKYYEGEADYGYYNNGVGMACYGKEARYDEDSAYEDAIEAIAVDIANGSEYFQLFDDNKFTEALANYIRTL